MQAALSGPVKGHPSNGAVQTTMRMQVRIRYVTY